MTKTRTNEEFGEEKKEEENARANSLSLLLSAIQICILDFCFDCFVIPRIECDICKTNKMNDAALTWMLLLANLTRGVHENYSIKVLEVLCFHLEYRWKSI